MVEQVLERFRGRIEQVPPTFSACKVDGKRAYKMARKGDEVDLKPKTLVIDELELTECNLPDITIRVVCSKGTYIRALARDIGEALQSGGHLIALRRTRVGDYKVENCLNPEKFSEWLDAADIEMPQKEND
jgi:tRNA pseudouridine55 synthase